MCSILLLFWDYKSTEHNFKPVLSLLDYRKIVIISKLSFDGMKSLSKALPCWALGNYVFGHFKNLSHLNFNQFLCPLECLCS